jgi:DNA-directed RNA polymerase specialized sigma24 family protein
MLRGLSYNEEVRRTGELQMEDDSEGQPNVWRPEPLTHRNTNGQVYQRDALVERQICWAVALDAAALRARADKSDLTDPDFLKEECLVYLIRHYHRAGDRRRVNDLALALLQRCANPIYKYLGSLKADAAKQGHDEVIEKLFGLILDLNSDKGDFLQVRFGAVLKKMAIRAFNQQIKARKRALNLVPLSALPGYEQDDDNSGERRVKQVGQNYVATAAADEEIIRQEMTLDALNHLQEPMRTAFLLRHYAGWPIEDQDPTVQTISRQFGKTPRTIRNWLEQAEAELERWRGEQL